MLCTQSVEIHSFCSTIGLEWLKRCVGAEISQKPINDLWDPKDGSIRWFSSPTTPDTTHGSSPPGKQQMDQLDAPLSPILEPFDHLAGQYSTNFFLKTWKATLRNARKNEPLRLEQMNELWEQSVIECTKVLTSLADYTLKLSDVDFHFLAYQEEIPKLSTELKNLAKGVKKCNIGSTEIPEGSIIDERISFIQQYWKLRNHANAADILLKLQIFYLNCRSA